MLSQIVLVLLASAARQALSTAIPAPGETAALDSAEDAAPGPPQEFIDQVLAHFTTDESGQIVPVAANLTAAGDGDLEKRATPADQRCNAGDDWVSRFCMSDVGPREWHDRCLRPNGQFYWVEGICPEVTYCSEEFDSDGDDTIICVPATPPREDNTRSTSRGARQYGYRTIQPATQIGNNQHLQSVLLQLGIGSGSVSGHLRSTDRSFIISPQNVLTANLRGRQLNLCRTDRDQSQAANFRNGRSCNPTNDHNFAQGDTVDFSFGLSTGQSAILFYNIGNS